MNELFYEFTPGFNWWYIVTPAMLVCAWLIGVRIPHRYRKANGAIGIYQSPRVGNVLSVTFSLMWSAFFLLESGDGMMQVAFNALERYESPFYAYAAAGFGLMFLIFAMYWLCIFCFGAGQNAKRNYLIRKYRLVKRQEDIAEDVQQPNLYVMPPSGVPSGRAAK